MAAGDPSNMDIGALRLWRGCTEREGGRKGEKKAESLRRKEVGSHKWSPLFDAGAGRAHLAPQKWD